MKNVNAKIAKKWSRSVVFKKSDRGLYPQLGTIPCASCSTCPSAIRNGYKPCPYLDSEYC